jgi:hypothetical protein
MYRGHLACSQRLVRRAWRRCDKPSNVGHKSEATERLNVACYVGDPQSSCAEAAGQSSAGRREVGRREQMFHSPPRRAGGRLRGLSNRQKAAVTPNPILLIAFSDGRARWPAYVLEGAALPSQIDERKGNRAIKYKSATPMRARAQPHARSTRAQSQRAAPEAKGGAELFCLGVCASSSRLVASKYSSNVAE